MSPRRNLKCASASERGVHAASMFDYTIASNAKRPKARALIASILF